MFSKKGIALFIISLILLPGIIFGASNHTFKYITLEKVSRYTEDRIAFQHVNKFTDALVDNSAELLLIVKDKRMNLFIDGYDDPKFIKEQRMIKDQRHQYYDDESMWTNKMNGKLDLVVSADRRVEVMKSHDEKFVSEKFGSFYTKVRDKFLQRHVDIFRSLMVHRRDSGLHVVHEPLPVEVNLTNSQKEGDPETKYFTSATAKTSDGRVYYCEDADGDGVTETFTVTLLDGFDWGFKSGPNMVFIYNNKTEELKNIIGSLAKESYYGTDKEMESMQKDIPEQEEEILNWIEEDLIHYDKFYD